MLPVLSQASKGGQMLGDAGGVLRPHQCQARYAAFVGVSFIEPRRHGVPVSRHSWLQHHRHARSLAPSRLHLLLLHSVHSVPPGLCCLLHNWPPLSTRGAKSDIVKQPCAATSAKHPGGSQEGGPVTETRARAICERERQLQTSESVQGRR